MRDETTSTGPQPIVAAGAEALVTVHPAPAGVQLHAVTAGQRVVLELGAADGLTLADEITIVCHHGPVPA